VAEGARLESVYTFTGIGGSNPSLSAISFALTLLRTALLGPRFRAFHFEANPLRSAGPKLTTAFWCHRVSAFSE
jgi:hypothetical protein